MNDKLKDCEWELIWASLRYFCGRETIASAMYPTTIINHYWHKLTDQHKLSLASDIKNHLEHIGRIGNQQINQPIWVKFMSALFYPKHYQIEVEGKMITVFEANGKVYPLEVYLSRPGQEIYLDIQPDQPLENKFIRLGES